MPELDARQWHLIGAQQAAERHGQGEGQRQQPECWTANLRRPQPQKGWLNPAFQPVPASLKTWAAALWGSQEEGGSNRSA